MGRFANDGDDDDDVYTGTLLKSLTLHLDRLGAFQSKCSWKPCNIFLLFSSGMWQNFLNHITKY
jgi:hypothetical protein